MSLTELEKRKLTVAEKNRITQFVNEWFRKFEETDLLQDMLNSYVTPPFKNLYDNVFSGEYYCSFSPDDKYKHIEKIVVKSQVIINFYDFYMEVETVELDYDRTIFEYIDCELNIFKDVNETFDGLEMALRVMLNSEFPDNKSNVKNKISSLLTRRFSNKFTKSG